MLKAARQKEIVALLQGGGVVEVSVLAGVSSFSVQ
jgi:DeoR/GlpR family transcriptional regulator of sugar metabolism